MLDAHQLNVFLVAAQTLNFTAAARQLHMTQPSVSQHIQALEQHFNTSLFIRSGRHLSLTDAGEALLPLARQMVHMSENIDETMQSLRGKVYGHLMVGCSTTVGKFVLPFLLADFMKLHPRVEATCYVTPRRLAVEILANGEVHLALASSRELNKEIEFRHILADPIDLIVPVDHPWGTRQTIEPDELFDADFIMREEGSGMREVLAANLADVGICLEQLRIVLTMGNSEAIALAVQEGVGVGFVPRMVVQRLVPEGVAVVKVRNMLPQQDIYIGCNASRPPTTAQTAFWEYATDPRNPVLHKLQAGSQDGKWPSIPLVAAGNGRQ